MRPHCNAAWLFSKSKAIAALVPSLLLRLAVAVLTCSIGILTNTAWTSYRNSEALAPDGPATYHSIRFWIFLIALIFLLAWILLAFFSLLLLMPRCKRRKQTDRSKADCLNIPDHIYRRPDPLIYDQRYLMDQGLAVTWDNPDIQLHLSGVPVPSSSLKADTEYDIVAQIWNGSTGAAALNMPVRFSYLSFGIGTVSNAIGVTKIDLPVKGAPGCPAFAPMKWKTPSTPGHYCLQVELIWDDDDNPANNLGQENVNVSRLNSPHAAFTFPVRNDTMLDQVLRLEVDSYRLPPRPSCDRESLADSPRMTAAEIAEHQRDARARHGRDQSPVPTGWRVEIVPRELRLSPGHQQDVTVDINAPDGFSGRQHFNVNAFDGTRLAGGVTLYVES